MGEPSILHLIVTFNGAKEVGSHLQLQEPAGVVGMRKMCVSEIIAAEKDEEERPQSSSCQFSFSYFATTVLVVACRGFNLHQELPFGSWVVLSVQMCISRRSLMLLLPVASFSILHFALPTGTNGKVYRVTLSWDARACLLTAKRVVGKSYPQLI